MIQVEVVIILCSNRPLRMVNESYDPQAGSHSWRTLQVCFLRFTHQTSRYELLFRDS